MFRFGTLALRVRTARCFQAGFAFVLALLGWAIYQLDYARQFRYMLSSAFWLLANSGTSFHFEVKRSNHGMIAQFDSAEHRFRIELSNELSLTKILRFIPYTSLRSCTWLVFSVKQSQTIKRSMSDGVTVSRQRLSCCVSQTSNAFCIIHVCTCC